MTTPSPTQTSPITDADRQAISDDACETVRLATYRLLCDVANGASSADVLNAVSNLGRLASVAQWVGPEGLTKAPPTHLTQEDLDGLAIAAEIVQQLPDDYFNPTQIGEEVARYYTSARVQAQRVTSWLESASAEAS